MASSSDPAMRLQLVPLAWTGSLAHVEASVSPVLSQPLPVSSPQTHLSALAFVLQWSGWSSSGLPAPVGKGNPQASAHRACHGWTVPVLGSFISVGASSSVGAGEPLPCLPRPCPGLAPGPRAAWLPCAASAAPAPAWAPEGLLSPQLL